MPALGRGAAWPWIVAAAVLARLAVMLGGLARLDDPDNYLPLARSIANGEGFALGGRATAQRPPLYPLMLAPLVATLPRPWLPWGVGALHLAMGAATVLLVGVTARRWGYSRRGGMLAMAVVALDPVLVVHSKVVMTETPAALLVAATLAALTLRGPFGPILGGVGFGLAALCRPSLLACAVLAAFAGVAFGPGRWRDRLARTTLLALATAATLAPWAWRNARVLGEPVWTTTHGGYTLALANNATYYAEVLDGPLEVWSGPGQQAWFDAVNRSISGLGEPEADRRLASSAWSIAREHPWTFARASMARLGRFWGVAPSGSVYPRWLRWATAAWTVPLWVALALGLARPGLRGRPEVAAVATLIALSLVHAFYWTDLRMRAPLVPAFALIAAGSGRNRPIRGWANDSDEVPCDRDNDGSGLIGR